MNVDQVCSELQRRIDTGIAWFEMGENRQLEGLELRKHTCTAELSGKLNTPGRQEQYGLAFVVRVSAGQKSYAFQVNIRIKPNVSEGEHDESLPYVAVYLVNQSKGKEELFAYHHCGNTKQYASALDLTVQEWFRSWLERALRTGSGKFLAAEMQIP